MSNKKHNFRFGTPALDGLVELCDDWLGETAELQDDMTFVIIKKR